MLNTDIINSFNSGYRLKELATFMLVQLIKLNSITSTVKTQQVQMVLSNTGVILS